MSHFLLVCYPVRVVSAHGRFCRTILARVVQWTVCNQDDEEELPPMHAFVALRDNNVMASADPRLQYTLRVSQTPNASPWPLEGKLRDQQIDPPKTKRFEAEPSGRATTYTVHRVSMIKNLATDESFPTYKDVADALSKRWRSAFAQHYPVSGQAGKTPFTTLQALGLKIQCIPGIANDGAMSIETWADCWMPAAYTAMTALHMVTPLSLSALPLDAFASLMQWLNSGPVIALLRTGNMSASNLANIVDCLSITECSVVSKLTPCKPINPSPYTAFFRTLAGMRASNSTVGKLMDDDATSCPQWAIDIGAIVPLPDKGPTSFTTTRWAELGAKTARILHGCLRIVCIVLPGGRGNVATLYTSRVHRLIPLLDTSAPKNVWYVAPTPGHAAATTAGGLDTLSVQDVIAGRVPKTGALACPDAICLLYAHGFGLRTFVAVMEAVCSSRAMTLVMAGDRLSWGGEGSPHPNDAGAPFRDVCAATARGVLRQAVMEKIQEAEPHWSAPLYEWPTASFPDQHVIVQDAKANIPLNACSVPLVALGNWRNATSYWKTYTAHRSGVVDQRVTPWWSVGTWGCVDALGWIGRIKTNAPQNTHVSATDRHATVHISSGVYLQHNFCCHCDDPNEMVLSVHPSFRSLDHGAPVRSIAKWSSRQLAESITVVVPEDDDQVCLQDVRAACSLASKAVYFVTQTGSRLPLLDAIKRQAGRSFTQLLDLLSIPDNVATCATDILVGCPLLAPIVPPCTVSLIGSIDTLTLMRHHVGKEGYGAERYLVPIETCRTHLYNQLRNEQPTIEVEVQEPVPHEWRSVSAPPNLTKNAIALPSPFSPVKPAMAASMSKYEIDTHLNTRIIALELLMSSDTLHPTIAYPPDNVDMERMALAAGGPHRGRREREAAVIHVLCLAAKNVAEQWFLEAERRLFIHRLGLTSLDKDTILAIVPYETRKTIESDESITDIITTIAGMHVESIETYMEKWITEPPQVNPIEDDMSEAFDFFDTLLELRQKLITLQ